ncbi:tRNA pseudouridine55 synthase [Geotalea daltonii FRC-32]|uniref:tRNA pseudouridine synthase B n=1 Tax=Geotalea daltonii (strain DSM 22248 / JCM 15807 / FRC-32) TaxID=316067 RepID=B9M1G3_GEODF|nr:tRNA pseudouridine55 synthase [Geotalea daltonii FRC-32]
MIDGFIVVDKPIGVTSHDVVGMVRRMAGQKKVGHTGTLDPFATGVLPVALGEGTKAITFLDEGVKEYQAVMMLGTATDTQDCTGNVTSSSDCSAITEQAVAEVCLSMVGKQSQLPPMFSALKKNGVPLYKLARQGTEVEREARGIEIFSLVIDRMNLPQVSFTVRCSRGTYVRTLAHDIGLKLGCGAHLVQLRRTTSGPFTIQDAVTPDLLQERLKLGVNAVGLVSPYAALAHLPDLVLSEKGAARVMCGIAPADNDFLTIPDEIGHGQLVRLSIGGGLLAVAEAVLPPGTGEQLSFRLSRVFNLDNSFTDQRVCGNSI